MEHLTSACCGKDASEKGGQSHSCADREWCGRSTEKYGGRRGREVT